MCALVQIYMVAGSNRCPTLRAGGLRVDPWTSGSRIVARMADANKSSAAFPPFPGETPEAHEVKEWWRATQPHLTSSQFALQNHQIPRELLDYTLATVPDALVSGGTDGITESAVQQRAAMIIQITDANDLKLVKRAAHKSEMLHSMYNAIMGFRGPREGKLASARPGAVRAPPGGLGQFLELGISERAKLHACIAGI